MELDAFKWKDYYKYEKLFSINLMVTTHKKPQTEPHNLKKREQRKKAWNTTKQNNRQKDKWKEPVETQSYQKAKDKKAIKNPYTSKITLNVNGLNSPIKN